MNTHSRHHSERIRIGNYELNEHTCASEAEVTVLLIHGIGVSSTYYRPLMEKIADRYHVVALDMPGYGGTPQPDHDLSIGELADIINRYVMMRGHDKCIIAGHSMGSQVVTKAVRDRPELYDRVILMAPTINKHERSFWLMAWRLFQDTLRERWRLNYIVCSDYFRMGLVSYLRVSRSMFRDHIERDIATLAVPVQIIAGGRDKISPVQWCRYLAGQGDHITLEVVDGAPHNFQHHSPEETARICTRFIV